MALSRGHRARHSLPFEAGDVLVIDTFADLPEAVLEQLSTAARDLWKLACEHHVLLVQLGPESNIWPDRQQPGARARGL